MTASIEFAEKLNKLIQARDGAKKTYEMAVSQSDIFEQTLSKKLFTDNWILLGAGSLLQKFEDKYEAYDQEIANRKAQANLHRQMTT